MNWTALASQKALETTTKALNENNINTFVVENGEEAFKKLFELIPKGAEVIDNTSITLETIGAKHEIRKSGNYKSVHDQIFALNKETQQKEMKELRSVPDYAVGSAHAVTHDGKILIASNSGSQIPGYAYGANHVIWVISTNKIVGNVEQGLQRIYEHSLPLESIRAHEAYGVDRSYVSKVLIFAREPVKNRSTVIFVKEVLGY